MRNGENRAVCEFPGDTVNFVGLHILYRTYRLITLPISSSVA